MLLNTHTKFGVLGKKFHDRVKSHLIASDSAANNTDPDQRASKQAAGWSGSPPFALAL